MDVSIIIINYNTAQLTLNCVESIKQKTEGIDYEIIIVDNASSDESNKVLSSIPNVVYVQNEANEGFGRANNIGVHYAKGRNILFLNSDTLLINNAISILSHYLDDNSQVGAVGGRLFNAEGQPTRSHSMIRPSIFDEINVLFSKIPAKILWKDNIYFNNMRHPIKVRQITGADMMVKKSVINMMPFAFNPSFFLYLEETELCYRINKLGFDIISNPEAEITHLEGASTVYDEKRTMVFLTSRKIYFELTHSKPYIFIANLIWKTTIISRLLFCCSNSKKSMWMSYWKCERFVEKEIIDVIK